MYGFRTYSDRQRVCGLVEELVTEVSDSSAVRPAMEPESRTPGVPKEWRPERN